MKQSLKTNVYLKCQNGLEWLGFKTLFWFVQIKISMYHLTQQESKYVKKLLLIKTVQIIEEISIFRCHGTYLIQ